MKKIAFIINPTAGKLKNRNIGEEISSQSNNYGIEPHLFFTEYRNHATSIAQELTVSNEFDSVIAVGGDGTVNEIVNGFDLESRSSFGVLPFGSGNDVGRFLYGKEKVDCYKTLFDEYCHEITTIDVGICKIIQEDDTVAKRKFINAVGIGFDAYVAFLNQFEKKYSGISSYIFAVFKGLKSMQPLDCEVSINNKVISGKYLLLTIGNGKTSGGGFFLNPTANPTDGLLNLTTVEEGSRLYLVRNLPLALIDKLQAVKKAKFYESTSVEIRLNPSYYVHLDGEIGSINAKELIISLDHKKLNTIKRKMK